MRNCSNIIYSIVKKIPKGKVLTYGTVAKLSHRNNPRLVGRVLHNNPNPALIPCHRVVNYQGRVSKNYAFGGGKAQLEKLQEEGVVVKNGRIDLGQSLWRSSN